MVYLNEIDKNKEEEKNVYWKEEEEKNQIEVD